jgi:hypothetical protein
MARKRTKDHKIAVQQKRTTGASAMNFGPSDHSTALSYQAPQGTSVKPTPAPTSTLVLRDQTEAILRQPLRLIYQDLVRTGVVTVGIIGLLMLLLAYLK